MKENIDRRALAGFRCIDATTSNSILAPLVVSGTPLNLFRNRSGIFAVLDAPGISRNRTAGRDKTLRPTRKTARMMEKTYTVEPSIMAIKRVQITSAPMAHAPDSAMTM